MTKEIIIDGVDVAGCRHFKDDGIKKPICRSGGCVAVYRSCLCEDNADCDYKQLKRLEQENKELKDELKPYKNPDVVTLLTNWRTGELDRIHNKIANERDTYRFTLDTMQRMVLSAWEQGKYLDGGLYNDLTNEFAKINEVLQ